MNNRINILFLGGAKRVSMARLLIEAGRKRGKEVSIFSYELDSRVPIAAVGKVIIGLRWKDPEIMDDLHRVVTENSINIILPFVDAAVGIASRYGEHHKDVFVPVSRPQICDMMFDKVLSADVFERAFIPAPMCYRRGRPEFPLIAKPRTGSASKGIKIIESSVDFRNVISPPDRYLIQEYIEHREEYTVDCYVTQQGRICCISPRIRLEVVGGEVSRTRTVDFPEIEKITRQAIDRIGLCGAVTVQFLRDTLTGRVLIMEVNPRLGGGAVCSVHAGADIPGMILDEACGMNPVETAEIEHGVEIVRYFDEVVFHDEK